MSNLNTDNLPVATADSKHIYTEAIVTEIHLDLPACWEDIVGNFFSEVYWVEDYEFSTSVVSDPAKGIRSWSKEGWNSDYAVTITFEEVDGITSATLKAEDFAKAYAHLIREGWTHCGGSSINDPDSCVTDAVLQVACFGEEVFG